MLVALTGGIASGKSTVAQLFAQHGAVVIRADDLAREVVAKGGRAYDQVVAHFGNQILTADGQVNRTKLAAIVFNEPSELTALEEITHPAVQAQLASRMADIDSRQIVIYEVPLLIEKNLFNKFDKSIAVIADLELRAQRAQERGLDPANFYARVENQTSDEQRRKSVDIVIENSGDLSQLAQQVDRAWQQLTS